MSIEINNDNRESAIKLLIKSYQAANERLRIKLCRELFIIPPELEPTLQAMSNEQLNIVYERWERDRILVDVPIQTVCGDTSSIFEQVELAPGIISIDIGGISDCYGSAEDVYPNVTVKYKTGALAWGTIETARFQFTSIMEQSALKKGLFALQMRQFFNNYAISTGITNLSSVDSISFGNGEFVFQETTPGGVRVFCYTPKQVSVTKDNGPLKFFRMLLSQSPVLTELPVLNKTRGVEEEPTSPGHPSELQAALRLREAFFAIMKMLQKNVSPEIIAQQMSMHSKYGFHYEKEHVAALCNALKDAGLSGYLVPPLQVFELITKQEACDTIKS
jgi:hypothetical protein